MFRMRLLPALLLFFVVFAPGPRVSAQVQLPEPAAWAAAVTGDYRVMHGITYLTANNVELKLDVWQNMEAKEPNATLIYFHGGGWVVGSKDAAVPQLVPWLEMGWNVVNVQYRLARVSLAPAAVEDCRCALRWVIRNAKQYNIDVSRMVLTGHSAGGHLSLTTGILPASAGLERQCPGTDELKVAAIVNWFGITDVVDILDGPNMQTYAVTWLGSQNNREEIARRVSPLTYVRPGLPPILTIHGDADPIVPYSHAVRMHRELDKLGVPNQFLTIPGGKHGGFTRDERLKIYATIRAFLARHNLWKPM